jgi:hypothetical protein
MSAKRTAWLLAVSLCATSAFSQDVNLHGTVTHGVSGAPLGGVLVALKVRSTLCDTTDAAGAYVLSTATAIAARTVSRKAYSGSRMNGTCLVFGVQDRAPVSVEVFTAGGAKVRTVMRDTPMTPGAYSLDLGVLGLAQTTYLVRFRNGKQSSVHQFVPMGGNQSSPNAPGSAAGSIAAMAKLQAGEVDTLVFSLSGFATLQVPVATYTGQYDAVLQPLGGVPQNVAASDGISLDTVLVTWRSTAGATGYQVFRQREGDTAIALLDTTTDTVFADTTVGPGPFRYRVAALYPAGQQSAPSAWDSGFRKVTNREFLLQYNNTTIYTSQQKIALLQSQSLGRDSAMGAVSGIARYNATFSLATFNATVDISYTNYRDDYLTVNGTYTTVVNGISGNGNLTGTPAVSGIYSGTVEYHVVITNRLPTGGYYRVTQTGGTYEDITYVSVQSELLH